MRQRGEEGNSIFLRKENDTKSDCVCENATLLRNVVAERCASKNNKCKEREREREREQKKENVHAGKKEGEKEFFHC